MSIAFQVENERLLGKVTGEVKSYGGWKLAGRQVKRGEKSKSFRVKSGQVRTGIDPITGEDRWETKWVAAYGFTIEQTY